MENPHHNCTTTNAANLSTDGARRDDTEHDLSTDACSIDKLPCTRCKVKLLERGIEIACNVVVYALLRRAFGDIDALSMDEPVDVVLMIARYVRAYWGKRRR